MTNPTSKPARRRKTWRLAHSYRGNRRLAVRAQRAHQLAAKRQGVVP